MCCIIYSLAIFFRKISESILTAWIRFQEITKLSSSLDRNQGITPSLLSCCSSHKQYSEHRLRVIMKEAIFDSQEIDRYICCFYSLQHLMLREKGPPVRLFHRSADLGFTSSGMETLLDIAVVYKPISIHGAELPIV